MHPKILAKGKVQGVFLRASTKGEAFGLSLVGFVRNKPNADVYWTADDERVSELISWIKAADAQMTRVIKLQQKKMRKAFTDLILRFKQL